MEGAGRGHWGPAVSGLSQVAQKRGRPAGVGVKVYRDVLRVASRLRECGGIVERVYLPAEDFAAILDAYQLRGTRGWFRAAGPHEFMVYIGAPE
jgi:hypothetical protein